MSTPLLLTIYCILIIAASLAGGWLPYLVALSHRQMQLAMSTVGGFMLGIALLHLIPHAFAELGNLDQTVGWTLAGLLVMFLLIRVFHVHAHEHGDAGHGEHPAGAVPEPGARSQGPGARGQGPSDHSPLTTHDHACAHDAAREQAGSGKHTFSWVGLAFGLALHTIIDGLALGAAVAAEAHDGQVSSGWHLYGLGVFLAVMLHKPLDSLSITSLMAAGGWSKRAALAANVAFALMCPLGAVGFVLGLSQLSAQQHVIVGCALAFAAGVFLCISLADLLPELTFHAHDRLPLTAALFLGVALAWAIGYFEPEHAHEAHDHGTHKHVHDDGHKH
ncbi:MAG TPA: ZIP family metal transporter [Pirellulaceae bacterium]|nr:ZIP family metal transporter [Pirellulaceae bacterium]